MDAPLKTSTAGLSRDVRAILGRRHEVWALVPRNDKTSLLAATAISAIVSLTATAIALVLGRFFKEVITLRGQPANVVFRTAGLYLIVLAGAYLLKETLQVARKYLVQNTTTRLARDTTIKLVSHLLMVDLSALSRDRVGALHGRISRSVEGFIKFVKLSFTDFIPAFLTAAFALIAGLYTDWRIGLVMAGVIPTAIFIT